MFKWFKVQTINKYSKHIIAAAVVIFLAILGFNIYQYFQHQKEKPVLITQEQAKDKNELAKAIHITPKESEQVIATVAKSEPQVTYYVNAPTVEVAAKQTQKAIEKKDDALPKVATEHSDRTAVVANTEQQKVDVYKINLNKAHKIKAGATYLDDKAYYSIGFQAGKVETIAHFDNKEFKGATVMYTVKEW